MQWRMWWSGGPAAASTSPVAASVDALGEVWLSPGSGVGDYVHGSQYGGPTVALAQADWWRFVAKVRVAKLTKSRVSVGIQDNPDPGLAIGHADLVYDGSVDGLWRGTTATGAGVTSTLALPGDFAPNGTDHQVLEMVMKPDDFVAYYVNGHGPYIIETNLPESSLFVVPFFNVTRAVAGAPRPEGRLDFLDWYAAKGAIADPRNDPDFAPDVAL